MSRVVAREKAFQLLYLLEMRKDDEVSDINELINDILADIRSGKPEINDDLPEDGNVVEEDLYVETEEDVADIIKSVLMQRAQNSIDNAGAPKITDDSDSAQVPILGRKNIDEKDYDYINSVVQGVEKHKADLDSMIEANLKGWKLSRLAVVDLSILRLAACEINYLDDIPVSVSINESVNLAKKFSSKDSASFINGVLGGIVRK